MIQFNIKGSWLPLKFKELIRPDNALIWRITHINNLDWYLDNGLFSPNSNKKSINYVCIGNEDIISKRANRKVKVEPYDTLDNYIPFYFTPFSMMFLNIHTGKDVKQHKNKDIIMFVTNLNTLHKNNVNFLFTDGHALQAVTNYYNELKDLKHIDWVILQNRDFKRDESDLQKSLRYQAEALISKYLPIALITHIICYTKELELDISNKISSRNLNIKVITAQNLYFT